MVLSSKTPGVRSRCIQRTRRIQCALGLSLGHITIASAVREWDQEGAHKDVALEAQTCCTGAHR